MQEVPATVRDPAVRVPLLGVGFEVVLDIVDEYFLLLLFQDDGGERSARTG